MKSAIISGKKPFQTVVRIPAITGIFLFQIAYWFFHVLDRDIKRHRKHFSALSEKSDNELLFSVQEYEWQKCIVTVK